ncbi:MAG: ATP-binding cassette domain-containing protein [Sandaracinaceae bacterium]|nr:ATP-binding cassette domain-containing protein [Sandaracinaceae bacterium]
MLLAAHAARLAAVLGAWTLLGRGALGGTLEPGWLLAWALALATTIPASAASSWAAGRVAITVGRLLAERLLAGASRLAPDAFRREGAGGVLARVLESSAVGSLLLGGSIAAGLSVLDLALAGWVLAQGAAGALHVLSYLAFVAVAAIAARTLYVRLRAWTERRLAMTHDLVERMVGHRTRLAQEPPAQWHEEEDAFVEGYLAESRGFDRALLGLSLLPRAWMLVGVLALAPAFVAGSDATSMAIALGGVLLASQAFGALSGGLERLAHAAIALAPVRPLFEAARREEPAGALDVLLAAAPPDPERPVLEARELGYRYAERAEPILRGCTLRLAAGDRVLLEGASGSGKSTLAALLGGLREPTHGLALVDGLDPRSLGAEAWRARVVTVPQFHENHVLSASFGFNGLMGRGWPPEPGDLEALREVCDALGLGSVLDRMPAGFEQVVGEQGWQLSHGERSRLFLARALMQEGTRVWILDESFAALDPVNLERCLRVVLERAPSLIVIAHP